MACGWAEWGVFDMKIKKSNKHMIEESIMLAIDSVSEDIQETMNTEDNKIRAEAIKTLAEAYDIVHRGKKAHDF